MGINDNLIEDYRSVITNALLNSQVIVDILGNDKYAVNPTSVDILPAEDLLWKNIIPQQYLPQTYTETESYIFYDIDEDVIQPSFGRGQTAYVELTIYFWIVTHKNAVSYHEKLKNDLLAREIKHIFSNQQNMGISKNHFLYNDIFNTSSYDFTGRIVGYKVTDWNDKIRYGG